MSSLSLADPFLSTFSSPIPVPRRVEIVVNPENYTEFFRKIYRTLVGYSENQQRVIDLLCEADFVEACQYLLKYRLDVVRHAATCKKVPEAIYGGHGYSLPLCVARVINSIGIASCHQKCVILVPIAPKQTQTFSKHLRKILDALGYFTSHLNHHYEIPLEKVSNDPSGTAYWALQVKCQENDIEIFIRASFSEWTAKDAMMAAIVNLPNGNEEEFMFESPPIRNIQDIRNEFFIGITSFC